MCYTRPGTSSCLLAKYQWILPFASRQKRDTDNFLSVDTRHEELQSSVKSTMISSPFVLCSNWYEKVSKDYRILIWDEIMNHTCFNRSVSRPFVQELKKREKREKKKKYRKLSLFDHLYRPFCRNFQAAIFEKFH